MAKLLFATLGYEIRNFTECVKTIKTGTMAQLSPSQYDELSHCIEQAHNRGNERLRTHAANTFRRNHPRRLILEIVHS
jgi:hypothetical protein